MFTGTKYFIYSLFTKGIMKQVNLKNILYLIQEADIESNPETRFHAKRGKKVGFSDLNHNFKLDVQKEGLF